MNVPAIGSNFEISGYKSVKCTGNPEQDAQNFATANGISVDKAKQILSGQFGAPTVQNNQTTGVTQVLTAEDEEETIVVVDKTNDTSNTANNQTKTELKNQMTILAAAIEAQDAAYVAWMNDYSNSTKQQTYWASVTYSGKVTDTLINLMNKVDSSEINASVADALIHLTESVKTEDSTYVAWKDGGSWDDFAKGMHVRYVNTLNFMRSVNETGWLN